MKFHLSVFRTSGSLILNKKKQCDEQEKESIIHLRVGLKNPSPEITVCHHAAILVPNGDPRDILPSHSR